MADNERRYVRVTASFTCAGCLRVETTDTGEVESGFGSEPGASWPTGWFLEPVPYRESRLSIAAKPVCSLDCALRVAEARVRETWAGSHA